MRKSVLMATKSAVGTSNGDVWCENFVAVDPAQRQVIISAVVLDMPVVLKMLRDQWLSMQIGNNDDVHAGQTPCWRR